MTRCLILGAATAAAIIAGLIALATTHADLLTACPCGCDTEGDNR